MNSGYGLEGTGVRAARLILAVVLAVEVRALVEVMESLTDGLTDANGRRAA